MHRVPLQGQSYSSNFWLPNWLSMIAMSIPWVIVAIANSYGHFLEKPTLPAFFTFLMQFLNFSWHLILIRPDKFAFMQRKRTMRLRIQSTDLQINSLSANLLSHHKHHISIVFHACMLQRNWLSMVQEKESNIIIDLYECEECTDWSGGCHLSPEGKKRCHLYNTMTHVI